MNFWFPAFLVLFEFSTYISNDMIMPGMPHVVHEFHASIGSASLALSAALLGNVMSQWLLGPLSDYKGRRPVLLTGVIFFVISCLGMFVTHNMSQFVILRALQGMGSAFVMAVGYPAVQEAFGEVAAVRTMALMASVSLLAPLLGPILGALIVTFFSWRVIFGVIAMLATLGLYGLWRYMPETVRRAVAPGQSTVLITQPFRFGKLVRDYLPVLSNRQIILGSAALGCACIPLMNWIALAPVILIEQHHETPLIYGGWQLPVFGAMIAGHITMARLADRWPLERLMGAGLAIMIFGILLTYPGYWLAHGFTGTVWGFAIYAYGTGPFYVSIYRRALFASESAKGTVAAAINTVFMLLMVIGVELSKTVYIQYGEVPLLGAGTLAILLALAAALSFARHMQITLPEAKTTPFDAGAINTRGP